MSVYITINEADWTVEQVRDTYADALDAADGNDGIVACPVPFPDSVHSGDSLTMIAHRDGNPREE